jgi:DNA polymerase III delta prime subunit
MILPDASAEQSAIVQHLADNNVVVDSVAGSGKTTTTLHIAKNFLNDKVLLLTYNAALKLDTREKAKILGFTNLEVHSYHSFCYKYYDKLCITDDAIIKMLKSNKGADKKFKYSIVIIDEAQDMTLLYYTLVCKILSQNEDTYRLCVIGDKDQSIYSFNNADQRFITMCDKIMEFNKFPWVPLKLRTSYRITNEMANFINKCVLQEDRMRAVKNGNKVRYVICDVFAESHYEEDDSEDNVPLYELKRYLDIGKYTYGDIFVLAPTLRKATTPARKLANLLTKANIPVFVPNTDDEKLDEEVIQGKIVFSTYHQSKGCERKVVLVFGFDEFYMTGIAKDSLPHICPNPLYVAITRAQENMTIFHHYNNNYLPFLDIRQLRQYADVKEHIEVKVKKSRKPPEVDTNVTDIIRFLPSDVLSEAREFLEFDVIQEKGERINIPIKTKQGNLTENVSEITGTAIPAYLEFRYTGSCFIQPTNKYLMNDYDDDGNIIPNETTEIDLHDPSCLLKCANEYCSKQSGYMFKLSQVQNYNWLSIDNLETCITRLEEHITQNAKFEKLYFHTDTKILYNRKLIGRIDCLDGENVWEFKCVDKMKNEHLIQLGLYAFLVESQQRRFRPAFEANSTENHTMALLRYFNVVPSTLPVSNHLNKNYFLFNILDNRILKLKTSYDKLCEMTKYIIQKKYMAPVTKTDKDFVKECLQIANRFNVFTL